MEFWIWIYEKLEELIEKVEGSNEYVPISERQNSRCFCLQGTEKLPVIEKAKAELEILRSCIAEGDELERGRIRRMNVLRQFIKKRSK